VELPLLFGGLTGVAVLAHVSPASPPAATASLLWTGWLVACVIACAARAMTHADRLAERLGEPGGTIILTIAAITIEVAAVCAIMMGSGGSPTVARDSMFAVLMVILNGLVGGCMLLGSLKRGEQSFNADSSSAYLPLLITLGTLTLVLPRFCASTVGGWMSDSMEIFVGGGSLVVYAAFVWMQSGRYRGYFAAQDGAPAPHAPHATGASMARSITLLVVSLVCVVACAEGMAGRLPPLLNALHLPAPFSGVLVALMVLSPEGFAALKASAQGQMQRSINVLLGSAVATIGLTVPAVLAVRLVTGMDTEFGLESPYIVLLFLTFIVSSLHLSRGRVNAIQGLIHMLILLAWIATIIDDALPREVASIAR
jgi:Ca2+:H+ antiporter